HEYIGGYHSQSIPSESVNCPCGEACQIRECPLHDDQREQFRKASRTLYLPDIPSTMEGIEALSQFIEVSGAFTRSGEQRVSRTAP
ncbi:hypothetical protein ARMGADRAFT_910341, partial [Armillaria gallica]